MNLDAAKILIDDYNYFAPSVHCSYYGCFQFIKSKLNTIGHTYKEIDEAIASSYPPLKLHAHTYPIKLMDNALNKVNDNGFTAREFRSKIKELKAFRTISDYHNEIVDSDKSKAALKLSQDVISLIKKKL
ncbi:hypothetical protein [Flavobacterium sp. 38-13]|uniref:hypothetical protein n=1 Tax=Flavobacterium sp. 38-13 TaxID=1896168 RepID=UPI000B2C2FEA|nr:hypothetical protein [Flavobacterium sp. 38-13]